MALVVGHRRADTSSTEGVLFYLAKKAYKACSCLDRMRLEMYSGQAKRDVNILWTTRTVTALLQTPSWGYNTTHNKVSLYLPFGAWGTYIFYLPLSTLIIIIIIIGIQPLGRSGQRPELSHATGMALVRYILGKSLGVVCHCFPPCLDVPTFATRCLHVRHNARDPIGGRWDCGRECCPVILPK